MQNFGVTNKEYYGMLWYFLEWSIATLPERDASRSQGYSLAVCRRYPLIHLGVERQSGVKSMSKETTRRARLEVLTTRPHTPPFIFALSYIVSDPVGSLCLSLKSQFNLFRGKIPEDLLSTIASLIQYLRIEARLI